MTPALLRARPAAPSMGYPASVRREALRLYASGLSYHDAAKAVGVSHGAVYDWAKAAGIRRPLRVATARCAYARRNRAARAAGLRLYASGLSTNEVAAIVGVSSNTVSRWVRAHGRPRSRAQGVRLQQAKRGRREGYAEAVLEVARLRAEGLTHREIAERLGIGVHAVAHRLHHPLNPYRPTGHEGQGGRTPAARAA